VSLLWKGDLNTVEKQFSSIPAEADSNGVVTWMHYWVLTLQRRFSEALALVQKFPGDALITESTAPAPKSFLEGAIYRLQGDKPTGQAEFAKARTVSEKLLLEAPDDPARHAQHGLILAALGEKDAAIKEGKTAVELRPESQDAFDGPKITASLAEIYALTGETDEALRLIDHLLETPNGLTISLLKLDPIWDPLRNDPRFQALIDKYAAKR
jgi:tetratricopeptide (TPR) repeat protein